MSTNEMTDAESAEWWWWSVQSFEEWKLEVDDHEARDKDFDPFDYVDNEEDHRELYGKLKKALSLLAEGHQLLCELYGPEGGWRRHQKGLDNKKKELPPPPRSHRGRNQRVDYVIYKEERLRQRGWLGVKQGDITAFYEAEAKAARMSLASLRREVDRRKKEERARRVAVPGWEGPLPF